MHKYDDTNVHVLTFLPGGSHAGPRWSERICCPDGGFQRRSGQEGKIRFITMFPSEFNYLRIKLLEFLLPENELRQNICRGTHRCHRSSNIINNQYHTHPNVPNCVSLRPSEGVRHEGAGVENTTEHF